VSTCRHAQTFLKQEAKLSDLRIGGATHSRSAANTVAKAYRVLESDGVIETRAATARSSRRPVTRLRGELATAAYAYAERAQRLGLDEAAALAAVREALRATYAG
jgi:DNA-binding transcriptional regulator YhcF (GntR family)